MIITPGYTFTTEETITAAKLNELGQPVVTLEAGDVDLADIDIDDIITELGDAAAQANYLHNGNFSEPFWQRGSTAISCPRVVRTFRADHWFCRPATFDGSGGGCPGFLQYSRAESGVDGRPAAPNIKALHFAWLQGMTNYVAVDFGQDIKAHIASALRTTLTVSAYIYNDTNAALNPLLVFETNSSFNVFPNAMAQVSSTASSTTIQDNNWGLVTWTVNASAFVNITNGLRMLIRFPDGALNASTKAVGISEVKLERNDAASPFVVERDDVHDIEDTADAVTAVPRNFLENPQFAFERWLTPTAGTTATAGLDNFAAERWFVRPAGADVTTERDVLTPGLPVAGVSYALKITGAASVTTIRVGQNIEMTTAAALFAPAVFSIYIYNGTGTAFTPVGYIETCDDPRDFGTVTSQASYTLTPCPDAAWTRVDFAFNGSDWPDFANGARVLVELPSGEVVGGQTVSFAAGQLELGAAASAWEPQPEFSGRAVLTGFKNLTAYTSTDDDITISADDLILTADDGSAINTGAFTGQTIDTAATGPGGRDTVTAMAPGWYRFYAVSDGETFAAILAPAASVLTMPPGWRYRAYLGEVYCVSAGPTVLRWFKQRDAMGTQERENLLSGAIAPNTWATIASGNLTSMIPPSAIAIGGTLGAQANAAYGIALESWTAQSNIIGRVHAIGAATAETLDGFNGCAPYWIVLGDAQSLYRQASNGTSILITITQYQLASR